MSRHRLLLIVSAMIALPFFLMPAIPQDLNYHNFASEEQLWGIPNFWNVMSNLPFLFVSISMLKKLRPLNSFYSKMGAVFALGVLFTSFGSAYYHYQPHNGSLFWDRLPMTIAFSGMFLLLLGTRVSLNSAKWLLIPVLSGGILSVVYWRWTETLGAGDLRPYAYAQFGTLLLIFAILMIYKVSRVQQTSKIVLAFILYAFAKLFETFDHQIYSLMGFCGGHPIKHFAAAAAAAAFAKFAIEEIQAQRHSRKTKCEQ